MYLQVLKNISFKRRLSRADLSRLAGVSRAAVTQWFKKGEKTGWVNVESKTLLQLAQALQINPSQFLEERVPLANFETRFLWDRLYPSMESFVQALNHRRLPAIARLVQEVGFHDSKKILGQIIVKKFDQYKKFIKPIRRKELEILWPLYN